MKLLIFLAIIMTFPLAHAANPCDDQGIFFQPDATTVADAAGTFGFTSSHDICLIKSKVKVSASQNISIYGYVAKANGTREVDYVMDNFKDGIGTTQDDCKITIKTVVTGKPNWDSIANIVSDPQCTSSPLK